MWYFCILPLVLGIALFAASRSISVNLFVIWLISILSVFETLSSGLFNSSMFSKIMLWYDVQFTLCYFHLLWFSSWNVDWVLIVMIKGKWSLPYSSFNACHSRWLAILWLHSVKSIALRLPLLTLRWVGALSFIIMMLLLLLMNVSICLPLLSVLYEFHSEFNY